MVGKEEMGNKGERIRKGKKEKGRKPKGRMG